MQPGNEQTTTANGTGTGTMYYSPDIVSKDTKYVCVHMT